MYGIHNPLTAPAGITIETLPDGRMIEHYLYACCHCNATWECTTREIGGKLAGGYCGRCCGFLCKNKHCLKHCVPFEQRLENEEAGLPRDLPSTKTKILVPELFIGRR